MFFPQCRLLVWGLSAAVSPRGLDMWDGRLGLPKAACAEERVEQAGEPAHDGDEGDLVRLAVGGQGFVTGIGGRFPADHGRSCHVEQLEELAGVAVEGGENRGIDAVVLCEPPGDLGEVAGALMQGSSNCSVTCST